MFYKRNKTRLIIGLLAGTMLLFVACASDEVTTVTEEVEIIEAEASDLDLSEIIPEELKGNVYKDGLYTGTAKGFGEGLTVEVVIEDHLIVGIEVVAHNEHQERFYGTPIATIPGDIVEAQDPIVDSVSGATCTSYGIMNATIDALSQAIISGQLPEMLTLPESKGHHK